MPKYMTPQSLTHPTSPGNNKAFMLEEILNHQIVYTSEKNKALKKVDTVKLFICFGASPHN